MNKKTINRIYKRKTRIGDRYTNHIECAYLFHPDDVPHLRMEYMKRTKRINERLSKKDVTTAEKGIKPYWLDVS